jgi:hypothetical protein
MRVDGERLLIGEARGKPISHPSSQPSGQTVARGCMGRSVRPVCNLIRPMLSMHSGVCARSLRVGSSRK